jgi:endoglycosylceramidase
VFERKVLDESKAAAARMGGVQVMTEFGASDNVADIATVADIADEALTGWMYWHYKNWSDPTTQSQESGEQGLFEDDEDLSTLKMDKARALIRPYPRATAGTPLSMSFDADNATFTYAFAPDHDVTAPSEIFVPALHFPDGYAVFVAGGTVTSEPGAPILTLTAHPAAERVTVIVTN